MQKVNLFLRSLVFVTLMVVTAILWSFVCFLAAPLPYNQRYFITSRWNVFNIWAAKLICGMRYQIKGFENLPKTPIILLSKHQSAWETIFLLSKMGNPLVYVFKKELIWVPFFGWALGLMRMIPIDRRKGKDAFKNVVAVGKLLKRGDELVATRAPGGEERDEPVPVALFVWLDVAVEIVVVHVVQELNPLVELVVWAALVVRHRVAVVRRLRLRGGGVEQHGEHRDGERHAQQRAVTHFVARSETYLRPFAA